MSNKFMFFSLRSKNRNTQSRHYFVLLHILLAYKLGITPSSKAKELRECVFANFLSSLKEKHAFLIH